MQALLALAKIGFNDLDLLSAVNGLSTSQAKADITKSANKDEYN